VSASTTTDTSASSELPVPAAPPAPPRTIRRSVGQWLVDAIVDRGMLPDALLRASIRLLLARRDRTVGAMDAETLTAFVERLSDGPVTVAVDDANRQHYEVPPEFFARMLGPAMKYSCALWDGDDLAAAERAMLELTCERAGLADGQDVLELGCGWGSLTLHMASRYPGSRIVAVSNSASQRDHIRARAKAAGLANVEVVTADVGTLGAARHTAGAHEIDSVDGAHETDGTPAAHTAGAHDDVVGPGRYDRVVSVEMFEHVRNHRELGRRIASWLRPGGILFVHVFAHRDTPYLFEVGGAGDWMARRFFTGGIMPSIDLLPEAIDALEHDRRWLVDGTHYARTLQAWLERLDAHADELVTLFARDLPRRQARAQLRRWRVFTIACEELFAAEHGDRWLVAHHRFRRVDEPDATLRAL
jgi:cyclopropane-fatty-acyl-phospholipid synthase